MVSMFRLTIVPILFFLLLISCSPSEEKDETTVTQQTTAKIAAEVVNSIKSPIDQAKQVKEIQESHNKMVKESAEVQK